jgi:hypothetical protein
MIDVKRVAGLQGDGGKLEIYAIKRNEREWQERWGVK